MLRINALTKTYSGGVQALQGVTLDIPKGMFGLLGPNGAGKSTLMRTIATLQDADSGSVYFDGLNVLTDPRSVRRQLGYLPQDFGVYPRVSAYDLLDHLAVLKGIIRRRERQAAVQALLEQTNLWDVRKKSVHTFSGGMRQRFGIAQALLGRPRLVIVDEPTAGLDPMERRRFHNLLSEIGEHVVVILSTHIVEDVLDLCPQMAIMSGGRVLVQDAPMALIRKLEGRVWTRHVTAQQLAELRGDLRIISTRLFAGQTYVNVVADARPHPGFELTAPTLEDVYFDTLANAGSVH